MQIFRRTFAVNRKSAVSAICILSRNQNEFESKKRNSGKNPDRHIRLQECEYWKTKVAKCFESESALFWPEKRQNAPWIFFSKNATISVKGATIWEFFFENDWQYQFLLHFYVIIFSKYPKYNISQRFFNIFNWKISFWRFFLILLGPPNYFWRHKEFQKRHSGAKAPLLATLAIC